MYPTLKKNSETGESVLVGEVIWLENSTYDQEYLRGRAYGCRKPGEKTTTGAGGVDYFVTKYPNDILTNAEYQELKLQTQARIASFKKTV